jgi:hypothetical protein
MTAGEINYFDKGNDKFEKCGIDGASTPDIKKIALIYLRSEYATPH